MTMISGSRARRSWLGGRLNRGTVVPARGRRVVAWFAVAAKYRPLMPILGVLAGAGTAKAGYGAWAAGAIAAAVPVYFGLAVSETLTRWLATWTTRIASHEKAGHSSARSCDDTANNSRQSPAPVRHKGRTPCACACWRRAA